MHNVIVFMKIIICVFILYLNAFTVFGQKVYVNAGTSSSYYHISKDCKILNSYNIPSFTITTEQAKSLGKMKCEYCYNNKDSNLKDERLVASNQQTNIKKTKFLNTFKQDKLEIPHTSKSVESQQIEHIGYTTSYNSLLLIPNWVAYCLTAMEVEGTYPRPKNKFESDPLVKGKSAEHKDYTNSGYSRGHMAPAADMKWSEQAMYESFYLSNICPQIAGLNSGVWERLENRCRSLARESDVYICCGPLMENSPKRIGVNRVAVPSGFFKVLCMKRKGKWQAIGFMFPNVACKGSMFDFACSVDDVENITGHNFFHCLPDDLENSIESIFMIKNWQ